MADKAIDFFFKRTDEYINLTKRVQKLEKKIKALDDEASDVDQTVKTAYLHSGKKRKRGVEEWLKEVKKMKTEFASLKEQAQQARYISYSRIQLAQRADTMMEEISDLTQQRGYSGELWLDVDEAKGVPLIEMEWRAPSFERNLREIWAQLMNEEITSIGICGMGGVGKTTLAKFIHNDLLGETTFSGQVYWVTASQEASIHKLQNDIAKAIKFDELSDEDDEMKRAAKLFHELQKKGKFVIVVDDVWTHFDVERMGIPLQGSKLIVTSRSIEVCRKMGCHMQIKVTPLCPEEAWELFKRKLGRCEELPLDVKEIAKSMAKKCAGLPLAIATVAGSMKGEDDIHEWRGALDDLEQCSVGEDDDVFPILEYSYNRLKDEQLKDCFLCCSLYPEDTEIQRDELIILYISEGLIERRSRQAEFDCGHRILNKLENVCLLEGGNDKDNNKYVKMHDLIREMALKITKSGKRKYMVKAGIRLKDIPEEREWEEDLDKVSLMQNNIQLIPLGKSPKCPKLSTLILSLNYLSSISDSFFAHLGELQILDLSFNRGLKTLPDCISDMKNLKALLLRWCEKLKVVPPLGNLEALKELDLFETKIEEVPKGLERLVKLRSLNMDCTGLRIIPYGILSKLCSLRSLRLPNRVKVRVEELEALKDLEELKVRSGQVDDLNQIVRSLRSHVGPNFYCLTVQPDNTNDTYYTEYMYDLRHKKRTVVLAGLGLGGGKSEVLLPEDIEDLQIYNCYTLSSCVSESLSELIRIQSRGLTTCRIRNFKGIKWILKLTSSSNSSFSSSADQVVGGGIVVEAEEGQIGIGISPCAPLQKLESLDLMDLPDLLGLLEWELAVADATPPPPVFPCLKSLRIYDCHRVTKLFTPKLLLRQLQNLEELSIACCEGVEEIITAEYEQTSAIDQCSQSPRTNSSVVQVSLPKLKELSLSNLPNLRSIYQGTLICDSIEIITIQRCSNLKRMPLFLPTINEQLSPPPALREIQFLEEEQEWWESLEWDNPQWCNVIQPLVSYEHFFNYVARLRKLPISIPCAGNRLVNCSSSCNKEHYGMGSLLFL